MQRDPGVRRQRQHRICAGSDTGHSIGLIDAALGSSMNINAFSAYLGSRVGLKERFPMPTIYAQANSENGYLLAHQATF